MCVIGETEHQAVEVPTDIREDLRGRFGLRPLASRREVEVGVEVFGVPEEVAKGEQHTGVAPVHDVLAESHDEAACVQSKLAERRARRGVRCIDLDVALVEQRGLRGRSGPTNEGQCVVIEGRATLIRGRESAVENGARLSVLLEPFGVMSCWPFSRR